MVTDKLIDQVFIPLQIRIEFDIFHENLKRFIMEENAKKLYRIYILTNKNHKYEDYYEYYLYLILCSFKYNFKVMSEKITRELNKFVNIINNSRNNIEYFDAYIKILYMPTFMLYGRGKYKYMYWYYIYKIILTTKIL